MRAKVFGSIETLSREISAPKRLVPLGEGDFSTPLRFGRNDNEAGGVFVLICSLQTNDKAPTAKLSNYPGRNQSFFHSPWRRRRRRIGASIFGNTAANGSNQKNGAEAPFFDCFIYFQRMPCRPGRFRRHRPWRGGRRGSAWRAWLCRSPLLRRPSRPS